MVSTTLWRGRFAPSPTGPLHFGSLIAALGSFLEARSRGGQWLLRIEDIDTPRVVAGAADDILHTLECLGLTWDGPVMYQSQRLEYYRAALEHLIQSKTAYPCTCSRRQIAQVGIRGPAGMIYPGICRDGAYRPERPQAIRLRTSDQLIAFHDQIHGYVFQNLGVEVGDFVIRRADGLFAYQLAVVVDDAAQGITHIVRGSDLLSSTPCQIYLQHQLGLGVPDYTHLPLVLNHQGEKLSKQTRAPALDRHRPGPALIAALRFLNQDPPTDLVHHHPAAILAWALQNWRIERIADPVSNPFTCA